MNKPANKQIEVQIMGQSYLLACPEGGESALLDAVAAGEQITITRHGRPVARLVPPDDDVRPDVDPRDRPRRPRVTHVDADERAGRGVRDPASSPAFPMVDRRAG